MEAFWVFSVVYAGKCLALRSTSTSFCHPLLVSQNHPEGSGPRTSGCSSKTRSSCGRFCAAMPNVVAGRFFRSECKKMPSQTPFGCCTRRRSSQAWFWHVRLLIIRPQYVAGTLKSVRNARSTAKETSLRGGAQRAWKGYGEGRSRDTNNPITAALRRRRRAENRCDTLKFFQ